MSFSAKTRYLLISAAIALASVIQLIRGYRWPVVLICGLTFLVAGNLAMYLAGSKERAIRRKQRFDYFAGKS